MSRIHHHFASARLSYQLGESQHHAGLVEFERLVYVSKFIEEHLPPIHTIGPRFKDVEALKMFSGLSLEELDNSIAFLKEHELLPPTLQLSVPAGPAMDPPTDEKLDQGDEAMDTGVDHTGDDSKVNETPVPAPVVMVPSSPAKST